jgi:hypothetical protein
MNYGLKRRNQMNPIERLEELGKARKLWAESELRLNFLRTQTGTPPSEPTDETILQWYQKNQHKMNFMTS